MRSLRRFESSFSGHCGRVGLEIVEKVHRLVVGSFEPDLVLILDIPESVALKRALSRGGSEDRFEKKGSGYQARVRQAFLQIATIDPQRYQVIDANQAIDDVTLAIFETINRRYQLGLELEQGVL